MTLCQKVRKERGQRKSKTVYRKYFTGNVSSMQFLLYIYVSFFSLVFCCCFGVVFLFYFICKHKQTGLGLCCCFFPQNIYGTQRKKVFSTVSNASLFDTNLSTHGLTNFQTPSKDPGI